MASADKEKRLRAPLLDRLLDDHPQDSRESSHSRHHLVRQLRESVRRDLEALFNTRIRRISPPSHLIELQSSLLNYGLVDINSFNVSDSASRKALCREIESAIILNEPRVHSVKVSASAPDSRDATLRFRIEAVLRALPEPEAIVFDSIMNPVNQIVDVVEQNQ